MADVGECLGETCVGGLLGGENGGGDRCVGCLRNAHGVLGDSGHRGRDDLGPSGVVAKMVIKECEEIWSVSQILLIVSWRVGFLCRFACRCVEDLLGFGLCRAIGLLEQAVKVVGRVLADWVERWVGV